MPCARRLCHRKISSIIFFLTEDQYTPNALMSAIEALPVMSDRKLIELSGLPLSEMKESELDDLTEVLMKLPEYEYNVLVLYVDSENFDAGTSKQPSKLLKKLSSCLKPVVFAKETPARLAAWTAKHFAAELIVAPPDAVNALLSKCGCDMHTLSSEIAKLCWYLKANDRERLTEADVALVSSESKEIAAFDFANAILDGRADSAFSILNELKLKKEKPEILLSGITRVVCELCTVKALMEAGAGVSAISQRMKIHEYKAGLYAKSAAKTDSAKLRQLAENCFEADVRIKSTSLDSYEVLDRLAAEAAVR